MIFILEAKRTKDKSYILFFASVFIMGLGISMVTHAELGTTAITSPPYVLSLYLPLSFGTFTMIFNLIYIAIQILLMRKEFPKIQYLQILVSVLLGVSIDFWTVLVKILPNNHYFIQLFWVLLGCFIVAFSIVMQLQADVVNNPAEGIVRAVSSKTQIDFGKVKIFYDISLVVLAAVLSLIQFSSIHGAREGTIISAIITGYFVQWIQKYRINHKEGD